ncbi:hypothetical protein [Paenibacillus humicus]|uniref:hypothetical protein n=2 Tax=Paenibacillus TaxID=44249 RepID=UPI00038FE59F|nr:hypothetical protein [Paenibacillus humicus]CDN44742.1 hypothetical protein BN871_FM_00020 [Paenibacillus sp. P22]
MASDPPPSVEDRVKRRAKYENTIHLLLFSLAMEELSMAHILNAEGEKIQHALGTLHGTNPLARTVKDICDVNGSVLETLKELTKKDLILLNKLDRVTQAFMQTEEEPF